MLLGRHMTISINILEGVCIFNFIIVTCSKFDLSIEIEEKSFVEFMGQVKLLYFAQCSAYHLWKVIADRD